MVEDFEKMNSLSLKEEIFNKASPAKTSKTLNLQIKFHKNFLIGILAYSYSSGKVNGFNNISTSNNSLSSQKK